MITNFKAFIVTRLGVEAAISILKADTLATEPPQLVYGGIIR